MEIQAKTSSHVTLRFLKNELRGISDPILNHAEDFTSSTLNLANLLKEQAYRIQNTFSQPPHAFGD